MSLMATYLRNLGLQDATQVVEGMSFASVLHSAFPSFLPVFSHFSVAANRIDMTGKVMIDFSTTRFKHSGFGL